MLLPLFRDCLFGVVTKTRVPVFILHKAAQGYTKHESCTCAKLASCLTATVVMISGADDAALQNMLQLRQYTSGSKLHKA